MGSSGGNRVNIKFSHSQHTSATALANHIARWQSGNFLCNHSKICIRGPNVSQLLEEVDFYFEECCKTFDGASQRAPDNPNEDEFHDSLQAEDSVSQAELGIPQTVS